MSILANKKEALIGGALLPFFRDLTFWRKL